MLAPHIIKGKTFRSEELKKKNAPHHVFANEYVWFLFAEPYWYGVLVVYWFVFNLIFHPVECVCAA